MKLISLWCSIFIFASVGIDSVIGDCNDFTDCSSCTQGTPWNGMASCRWCERDTQCHDFGSVLNPCHYYENIDDPEMCTCSNNCIPSKGYGPEVCDWYVTGNVTSPPPDPSVWTGGDFLLPDYALAAQCACSGGGNPLWQSTAASCVRTYLLKGHQSFSSSIKQQMRSATLSDGNSSSSWMPFLPMIYQMHQDAYKTCCCPGTVAPLITWELIFYAGEYLSKFCDTWPGGETMAILEFGRCGCGW